MFIVDKNTKLYGSFSDNPGNNGCRFFNAGFLYHNINAIYKSFSSNNIDSVFHVVDALGLTGFALSSPLKQKILSYVTWRSYEVNVIGAANTVVLESQQYKLYNTDWLAAKEVLKNRQGSLYILGNGGYAKAVMYAADKLNIYYQMIDRSNWNLIPNIRKSTIYNCTPVENISIHNSNMFIDGVPNTITGKQLSLLQAKYQFKLYTNKNFEVKI